MRPICQVAAVMMMHCRNVIQRLVRESVYEMWDGDHIRGVMQDIFAETFLLMAPVPKINGNEEPAANDIQPEQEAPNDAIQDRTIRTTLEQH